MKKVMLVFGTRPEAIKMCPLIMELNKAFDNFETIVCVTGQHREMLDQVLGFFEIIPDVDLNIMKGGQDLYDITSRVLIGMRDALNKYAPDIVIVHGDTTTTFAASLAAFYQKIPVAHVEAGLRTYNLYSPWPEEINRQLASRICQYHFAPTSLSRENLLHENIESKNILVTGNTVIDALHIVVDKINTNYDLEKNLALNLLRVGYDVQRLQNGRKMILITGHRRENFGGGFVNICKAIRTLSRRYETVDFVYPMHLNPNVRTPIYQIFKDEKLSNVFFIEPLEYLSFIFLMEKSCIVMTDSGGIQEEAPSLGKPVLVMRDTTERPEAIEAGTVKLVGTDCTKIVEEVSLLLENELYYTQMNRATNPYGDGNASKRIVEFLKMRLP